VLFAFSKLLKMERDREFVDVLEKQHITRGSGASTGGENAEENYCSCINRIFTSIYRWKERDSEDVRGVSSPSSSRRSEE
jgi:hypothetical protein